MSVIVLLSSGLHPVSRHPSPVQAECAAIALACTLSNNVIGLHVGPEAHALRDYFGHGLRELDWIAGPAEVDPLLALLATFRANPSSWILTGNRGCGGADTGMLPYRLAAALKRPIVADVVAAASIGDELRVIQSMGSGRRCQVIVTEPVVLTVHPSAPVQPYIHAWRRQGKTRQLPTIEASQDTAAVDAHEVRPYRARARLLASGAAPAPSGRLLLWPNPDGAAVEILRHLQRLGLHASDSDA